MNNSVNYPSSIPQNAERVSDIFQLTVWTEKKPMEGEDAEPILQVTRNEIGLLGVFDGMGGAGSTQYTTKNGEVHTGAYIASRLVRDAVEQYFRPFFNRLPSARFGKDLIDDLKNCISIELRKALVNLDSPPSKVKSSLSRRLPTTAAVIYFHRQSRSCICDIIWAGDSRIYILSEKRGLQQLTRDDIKSSGDAFAELMQDSPLSNCISADNDFKLNHSCFDIEEPVVLLTATDGCFGYVQTPAHFEHLLLKTMQLSNSFDEWKGNLTSTLQAIAGDDVSMALITIGWNKFSEMKGIFLNRFEEVQIIIKPVDDLVNKINKIKQHIDNAEQWLKSGKTKKMEICQELWNKYRLIYEQRLRETQR